LKFDTKELYDRLQCLALPLQIAVCENLGYPEEKIVVGPVATPPATSAALYSLVIGNF
jgi:cobalt-precorrin-7 (C5)-methyltransferase